MIAIEAQMPGCLTTNRFALFTFSRIALSLEGGLLTANGKFKREASRGTVCSRNREMFQKKSG